MLIMAFFGVGLFLLPGTAQDEKVEPAGELLNRMESIIIPELNFRDQSLDEVVDFLMAESRRDGRKGVKIVIDLDDPPEPEAEPDGDSFFDGFGGDEAGGPPRVTMRLRRITLKDALDFVTAVTTLKYTIQKETVVIERLANREFFLTRFYPVDPNLFAAADKKKANPLVGPLAGKAGNPFAFPPPGRPELHSEEVTAFFQELGVAFPPGTWAIYQPQLGQVVVVNSAERHKTIKETLDKINKIPPEAKIKQPLK